MPSKAASVDEYLAQLPEDRRRALSAVRDVFRKNLDKGYREQVQYGMIGYCVPHSIYPAGYHCDPKQPLPFGGLASQKSHMSMYLFGLYVSPGLAEEFQRQWKQTGKKLDMGKACVRFKTLDDVPLELLAETLRKLTVEKFVELYDTQYGAAKPKKPASARKPAKKQPSKTAKKTVRNTVRKTTRKTANR